MDGNPPDVPVDAGGVDAGHVDAPTFDAAGGSVRRVRIAMLRRSPRSVRSLEAMYAAFGPDDGAQGIPPPREDRRRWWIEHLLADGVNLVARLGGRVVGHAVLMPDGRGWCELAVHVHPAHQSLGIGRSLTRAAVEVGREMGVDGIWSAVERWNVRAVRICRRHGFAYDRAEDAWRLSWNR
jgi:GNAT superfamily N-acetyltransferase